MCKYSEIEEITLSNGKTIKQINAEVSEEVKRIYLEGWAKGISIPFWDEQGNYFIANPDGSENRISYNPKTRSYQVLEQTAAVGKGRYAYLLQC